MNLNVKPISVDTDRALVISGVLNPVPKNISLVRGNEYIIQANCYSSSYSNTTSTFSIYDDFGLYIGRQYCSNAAPVVVITDPSKWNQTSDWSAANVASGQICVRANVDGSVLTSDIGNVSSQNYTMEIVLVNNVSGTVLIAETTATIQNAVQL